MWETEVLLKQSAIYKSRDSLLRQGLNLSTEGDKESFWRCDGETPDVL